MPEVLTEDDVLAGMRRGGAPEAQLVEDAERLIDWAEDESVEFEDGFDRSTLLVFASGQLTLAGRHDEAVAVVDRAVETYGVDSTGVDLRGYQVMTLSQAGRVEEALAVADAMRRDRPRRPFTCVVVAESLDELRLFPQAERWCSIGLRILEDVDPDAEGPDWDRLLVLRRDVRRAQGKEPDAYDTDADAVEQLRDEGF